jgi:hypothetical protein
VLFIAPTAADAFVSPPWGFRRRRMVPEIPGLRCAPTWALESRPFRPNGARQPCPTRVSGPNPGSKYFPSCLHARRNSGSASFTRRVRVDDGAPPLLEGTVRGPSGRYAGTGGQGSSIGRGRRESGTGRLRGHRDWTRDWDGTSISSHCYFVPPWRPTTSLVGKRSPAGTQNRSAGGEDPFSLREKRIPGRQKVDG